MTQADFFDLVEERETVPALSGSIVRVDASRWQATIGGGWWLAYGATRKAAIKAVIDRYNAEANYKGLKRIREAKV